MCPGWLKMVLGTSRDMFETILTIRGSSDSGFEIEDLEGWRQKTSIFAGFNVFMLFFLIKAFKTVKTAIFRPHPSKSSIPKSESEDSRMSTWSQTCPGGPPKPFSIILDTSGTLIKDIWDDLKKLVDPPPKKKIPIFFNYAW